MMGLEQLKAMRSSYWEDFCKELDLLIEMYSKEYDKCDSEADFKRVRVRVDTIRFIKAYPAHLIEQLESSD